MVILWILFWFVRQREEGELRGQEGSALKKQNEKKEILPLLLDQHWKESFSSTVPILLLGDFNSTCWKDTKTRCSLRKTIEKSQRKKNPNVSDKKLK